MSCHIQVLLQLFILLPFSMMNRNLVVIFFGVICLSAVQSSPVNEAEVGADSPVEEKVPLILPHAYSIINETGSTFEAIMREIAARKAKETGDEIGDSHSISKRALGCSQTNLAYGSTNGTAFSDFTTNPWPCGVDITQITVGHGVIVDSLQFTYKTVDQTTIIGERRGGTGGTKTTIVLEEGERITGVSGLICRQNNFLGGTVVQQLAFDAERQDGQKVVYGPYGMSSHNSCQLFSVNAKISSIFGRVHDNRGFIALSALGFYYEDESRGSQHTAA